MKQYKGLIAGFLFALGIVAGAAVPTAITDLSSTAASNSPSGSENVFPNLDDYLRAGFKFQRDLYDGALTLSNKTLASPVLTGLATFSGTGELARMTTTTARGSGAAYLRFQDPSGQKGFIGYAGATDKLQLVNTLNDTLALGANNTEYLTIAGDGGATHAGAFKVSANAGLGAAAGSGLLFDYASSVSRAYIGDGSGYEWRFSKRTGSTTTDYFGFTDDGRVYGKALHNNAGSVTGTTNQYIASGTYTPTLTNGTNVAASTARLCHWMRVGNVVTVAGTFDVDATSAGGVQTILSLSLPIASNFTAATDAGGTAISAIRAGGTTADNGLIGQIQSDATNDRAIIYWNDGSGNNITVSFTFTYVVL